MNTLQLHKLLNIAVIFILFIYIISGFYNVIQTTYYTYSNSKISSEFNGYRIVQISDYHCKIFGKNNKNLISAIANLDPDIIVLTGDMIDEDHPNINPVKILLQAISKIAPIYSVSGNNEFVAAAPYSQLLDLYDTYGVINLDNGQSTILRNGSSFIIYGLSANRMDILYNRSALPTIDPSSFSLALYHYSNQFESFFNYGFDLILSGHTHGGVIRLPFVGGVIGNGETFFPKYDAGEFTLSSTTMISSRGLGDANIPRFHNRPELVCITLQSTK